MGTVTEVEAKDIGSPFKQRFEHFAFATGWSDGRYDLRFALAAHVWSLQHSGSASTNTTDGWV